MGEKCQQLGKMLHQANLLRKNHFGFVHLSVPQSTLETFQSHLSPSGQKRNNLRKFQNFPPLTKKSQKNVQASLPTFLGQKLK